MFSQNWNRQLLSSSLSSCINLILYEHNFSLKILCTVVRDNPETVTNSWVLFMSSKSTNPKVVTSMVSGCTRCCGQ